MKAYVYKAALYCEACGEEIRKELDKQGKKPANPDHESSYDSDDYPKGPYPVSKADSPQHCDVLACSEFLKNPLTSDGRAYVIDKLKELWERQHESLTEVGQMWKDFYNISDEEIGIE